jgi:hypothetical protein
MQTFNSSSSYGSPCRSPCGSPCDFEIRSCFKDSFETTPPGTPRVLFGEKDAGAVDLLSSPSPSPLKKQKLNIGSASISGPPDAPSKRKKNKPIPGLPVLDDDDADFYQIIGYLGEGSFGKVKRIQLKNDARNPDSPSFALKIVPSGRASPKDLSDEGNNFGKKGCNWGVAMTTPDGTFIGVSTIAKPLSDADITAKNIDEIIALTSEALMEANISVLNDAGPSNIGIIEKGTPTVIFGQDGLPCAGPLILEKTVKIIDVGPVDEPENANPMFSAMIPAENMIHENEIMKYRRFKCDMMSALLRNRLLAEPRNEYDIVREICNSETYGYTYAAGDRR